MNKKIIWGVIAVIILGGVSFYFMQPRSLDCCHGEQYEQYPVSSSMCINGATNYPHCNADLPLNIVWKDYINPEHGFRIKYPSTWVVETGLAGTIVQFHPIDQVQKPDTDTVIDRVFVRQEFDCVVSDWNTGFSDAQYKHGCIVSIGTNLGIDMVAQTSETQNIEDKIMASFKALN